MGRNQAHGIVTVTLGVVLLTTGSLADSPLMAELGMVMAAQERHYADHATYAASS
jgi:Tfp pilus assembly protein PilE